MKYHKIEIDEEVYQYLLSKISDFEDTPNTILRRELFKNRKMTPADNSKDEVDRWIEDQGLSEFETVLIDKFPNHISLIKNFFSELLNPGIDKPEINRIKGANSDEGYMSLPVLNKRGNDLVASKPASVKINDTEYAVNSWTEFDEVVIKWFLRKNILQPSKLPITATGNKYFINSVKKHKKESYDAKWNEVVEGVYFDSKFNAPDHIRNVSNLIDQLAADPICTIRVKLHPGFNI